MAIDVHEARSILTRAVQHDRRLAVLVVMGGLLIAWAIVFGSAGPRSVAALAAGAAMVTFGLLVPTVRRRRSSLNADLVAVIHEICVEQDERFASLLDRALRAMRSQRAS